MLLPLLAALVLAPSPDSLPPLEVAVDSGRHEVTIVTPASDLPDMSGMSDHSHSSVTPVYKFQWPVNGWFRGFRISVIGADGTELSHRLLHHMIMVNYDRRQLLYEAAERLWGAGLETGSFALPKTIGVPVQAGSQLGLYIAWHNATGADIRGARLKIVMLWTPTNQNPRPVDVLPMYFDVNLTVGGDNEFDVPPGRSEKSFEFSLPTEGRILGVSGHLHDYGREVRLEDAESGKVLTRVESKLRPDGRIRGMERHLFGVAGEGLRLRANHRYRVVAVYDNPTGETLVKGAMGSLVGIFAPRNMAAWPAIDTADTTYQRDLRFLSRRGGMGMRRNRPQPAPAMADSMAMPGHSDAHHHD